jgi:hypothetical protein
VVRVQRSNRFFDPTVAGWVDSEGWQVKDDDFADTRMYSMTRGDVGQIMLQDWSLYEDPTDPDHGM